MNESTSLVKAIVKVTGSSVAAWLIEEWAGASAAPGRTSGREQAHGHRQAQYLAACVHADDGLTTSPPTAPQQPHEHVTHGVVRPDPYAWMADESPALLEHLTAERGWYDVATAHLGSLVARLTSEMEARVPEVQRSGTWSRPRFSYYTRDERNRDYAVIWRESRNDLSQKTADSAAETGPGNEFGGSADASGPEVVLDVNALVTDSGYLDLGYSIVSPDENLLAYAVDTSGAEVLTLRFRDLRTGRDLPDIVAGVAYSGAWTNDSSAFFYAVPDEAWRPDRVALHRLGTDTADDTSS